MKLCKEKHYCVKGHGMGLYDNEESVMTGLFMSEVQTRHRLSVGDEEISQWDGTNFWLKIIKADATTYAHVLLPYWIKYFHV